MSFRILVLLCCNTVGALFLITIALLLPLQAVAETRATPSPVIVASYNLDNYIMMPRWIDGHFRSSAGKPAAEKSAVVNVLATIHPDILGVMEMGNLWQFHDLQRRLRSAGFDYPYTEYVASDLDQERHLALLSRFPIVESHSQKIIPLVVNGIVIDSPRGLLDVTIALQPEYQLRVICVHFKSKLSGRGYSEAALREAEALHLHATIDAILKADPATHLLVMGDFNDTENSVTLADVLGPANEPHDLASLSLTDSANEDWTEYWKTANLASRIDYMMVSKNLLPDIDFGHSGIARPSFWNQASDHCALFTEIILEHFK